MYATRMLVVVGAILIAGPAVWAAPINGLYYSPDLGNDFLNGRWSESFAGGARGAVGNVIHGASWDGNSLLATQWEMTGLALQSVSLIADDVVGGNGVRTYRTIYTGGTLTLADVGPWWNGSDTPATEYQVDVTTYRHITDQVIVNNQMVSFTTSVYLQGTFPDFPGSSVEFVAAAAVPVGTGTGIPGDYPSFSGADNGDWGVVQNIRMSIVPEPATLGLLALGTLALLRRRRD